MKPSKSNRPFSIHRAGSLSRIGRTGSRFYVRSILKIEYTLLAAPVKTGPVRDGQQRKRVPYECGRWYIGEASGPSEEHNIQPYSRSVCKCEMNKHMPMKKAKKICSKEARVLQIKPNITYREYKESAHTCL
jgi:hypothetical protein